MIWGEIGNPLPSVGTLEENLTWRQLPWEMGLTVQFPGRPHKALDCSRLTSDPWTMANNNVPSSHVCIPLVFLKTCEIYKT